MLAIELGINTGLAKQAWQGPSNPTPDWMRTGRPPSITPDQARRAYGSAKQVGGAIKRVGGAVKGTLGKPVTRGLV